MKIVSQTIAHYGSDYIGWALRSVAPFVDECLVFYTPQPSHGASTNLVCPDTEKMMYAAIETCGVKNYRIIKGVYGDESIHRSAILAHTEPGDIVVVADADEIWVPNRLERLLEDMKLDSTHDQCIRLWTPWRSFGWIVKDEMQPRRIFTVGGGQSGSRFSGGQPDMFHFGYARKPVDVEYKIGIHGHRNEWRANWFIDKYVAWRPGCDIMDTHPTCVGFWNPERFDRSELPEVMYDHPYYEKDLIV